MTTNREMNKAVATDSETSKAAESGYVWVGYLGDADPRAEDYARRRFRLGDVVPERALLSAMQAEPEARSRTWEDVLRSVASLELEVSTTLVTENTNGQTCANAWVRYAGEPRPVPTELDRELVAKLAEQALRDLEERQSPQSVRNATALLLEIVNGRAVLR